MPDDITLPPPDLQTLHIPGAYDYYNAATVRRLIAEHVAASVAAERARVPDERAAFEVWSNGCFGMPVQVNIAWRAWQARAELSAPASPPADAQAEARDAARYQRLIETLGDRPHGKPSLWAAWDDDIDDCRSAAFFGLRTKEDFDTAIDSMQAERGESERGA